MHFNVVIGTVNPTVGFKLDVIGNIRCQSLTQFSSRDYKKDIQLLDSSDYSNIIEKLKQTKVYRFRYKEADKDSKLKIGLIAEEAPEEIVSHEGKGIDIGEAVGFLMAAVKAQAEEIKVLKQEISGLKGIK